MKMYLCECCGKSFKFLSKLREHNNRQTPCRPATHHCSPCGKGFSGYQSLWKHKQRCRGQVSKHAILVDSGEEDRRPRSPISNNRMPDPSDSEKEESEKYVKLDSEESSIGNESSSSNDIIVLDVRKLIMDGADGKMIRLFDSFKYFAQLCQSFARDKVCRTVIQTAQKVKENNDMDFDDALDYAMDKRKSLIFTTALEAMSTVVTEDNEEQ